MHKSLPIVAGGLALLGIGWIWRQRETGIDLLDEGGEDELGNNAPVSIGGELGDELKRAHDNGWDVIFAKVEKEKSLPRGLLSAIASRETNMRQIIGDNGHGRGLVQIDDRGNGRKQWLADHDDGQGKGLPDVLAASYFAADLILDGLKKAVEHGVPEKDQLQYAIASYNAGDGGAHSGFVSGNIDAKTTGHDYGKDVLRRWREMFPGQSPAAGAPSPSIASLIAQVNTIWPNRDRSSDAVLGDESHPDHHAGIAVDITNDTANGPDLALLGEVLISDPRTHYVIFNGRIANSDYMGGAWQDYPMREPGESDSDFATRRLGFNRHARHMHVSVKAGKANDARPWPQGGGSLSIATHTNPAPPAVSDQRLSAILKDGLVGAWNKNLVDNLRFLPIQIGPYEIQVTDDAASINGIRIPASFDEILTVAGSVGDIIPNTKATVDARWKNAARKLVIAPITGGAKFNDLSQVQIWTSKLPPVSDGELTDGAWKEYILEPGIQPGKSVNYGLRGKDGNPDAVWQSPGHAHDDHWKDYSQFATFVKRKALKNGQEVDLLEELKNGSIIGGPIPQWIIDRLSGANNS